MSLIDTDIAAGNPALSDANDLLPMEELYLKPIKVKQINFHFSQFF